MQARADALAAELDASRAQAAQADSEAAETEAAFHMLQAEARPCRVGFGLRSRTGALFVDCDRDSYFLETLFSM